MNKPITTVLAGLLATISASFAATVITVGSDWQAFTYPIAGSAAGQLAPNGPFAITSPDPVRIDVTDFLQAGEWYSIFDGTDVSGSLLLLTPDVAFDAAPSNSNLDQAFADPRFSHGQFTLPAGSRTFVVRQEDSLPGFTVWNLGIRATAVPEPSTAMFAAMALSGFLIRRIHNGRSA
jgi:hypothetical protein